MSSSGFKVLSTLAQIARSRGCLAVNASTLTRGIRAFDASCLAPSRSLWCSTTYGVKSTGLNFQQNQSRALHTAGDADLADFLKDEIKQEKDIEKKSGKLPKIKNFEVTESNGPNVVLTRKNGQETVTVKFNVTNSVEDDVTMESEAQEGEDQNPQLTSRPPFIVEINKGGDKTLAVSCVFPPPEDMPHPEEQDQNEQYLDLIEIQDVALLNKGQEWSEDVYSLSGSIMDGNLYDMLLKLLEDRGVDADFIQEVIDFSTSYEHKKYIELLEQLKAFADSK